MLFCCWTKTTCYSYSRYTGYTPQGGNGHPCQTIASYATNTDATQDKPAAPEACQCGNRKEDEMIKTGETLTLDKDDEWRLRQLLDSLTDFSKGLAIAEADAPEIREAVWSLQKKLKRAEAAPTQSRQATAQRAA